MKSDGLLGVGLNAAAHQVSSASRKAFLSYSSKDRALVSLVADELGRECAIYDEKSFDIGYYLEDAIRDGLDRSSVFVLFASRHSLGPDRGYWLTFEDKEGRERSLTGIIHRPLCFIIDEGVSIGDIPPWLVAAKVGILTENAPKLIAYKIRQHLNDLIIESQAIPVVGRGLDSDRAKRLIRPSEGAAARTVAFYGVNGIGRRTLCRDIFRDLFMLQSLYEIRVEEGDDLADLTLKIADSVGLTTRSELEVLRARIEGESRERQLGRCVQHMQLIVNAKLVPVFFDDGGILDNDGHLTRGIEELRGVTTKENDIFMALILSRRLVDEKALKAQAVPSIRVDALPLEDTALLISSLADRESLSLDQQTIRAVAKWVRGHPPSATHAVELLVRDGVAQVIDGSQIVAYRDSYFVKVLERDGALTKRRQVILRTLGEYLHLPEQSLIAAVGATKAEYNREIRYLLDKAFVIPERSGLYRIADPLVDSIHHVFSGISVPHAAVASGLTSYLKELDELVKLEKEGSPLWGGRLDAERLLWRANVSSGEAAATDNVFLAADVINALRSAFYEQRYEDAEQYGITAMQMRPESAVSRSFLIRAYVRQRKYDEAKEQIIAMEDRGFIRDAFYLRGYLDQYRGDHQNAVYEFRQAMHYGRTDATISRDLAESLFFVDEYGDAEHYVKDALKKQPDNRFSLDLLVRILIRLAEFSKARIALKQLQIYDDSAYFLHRKSVLEFAEGNKTQALSDALAAFKERKNDVSIQIHLAVCYIALGKFTEARAGIGALLRLPLGELDPDVITGLNVRLSNARRKYNESLLLCDKIKNKDRPLYLALRLQAVDGFIATLELSDPHMSSMVDQREQLRSKLGPQPIAFIEAASTFFKKP